MRFLYFLGLFSTLNFNLYTSECSQKMIDLPKYTAIKEQAEQLYSPSEIDAALDRVAAEITAKLSSENPLFLCVLNGSIVPTGQLLPRLDFPLQLDYIHATRYRGKMKGGELEMIAKPRTSLKGRTVVLIEDIIDTGFTLQAIYDYCLNEGAKKVYTVTLLDKCEGRDPEGLQEADFVGIRIPDRFVIGYGLDYEDYFRNMDGIYVMPLNELF